MELCPQRGVQGRQHAVGAFESYVECAGGQFEGYRGRDGEYPREVLESGEAGVVALSIYLEVAYEGVLGGGRG